MNIDPLNTWVAAVPAFLTYSELLRAQHRGGHCFIQAAPTLYEFNDFFVSKSLASRGRHALWFCA
jgi:hypothetical protein